VSSGNGRDPRQDKAYKKIKAATDKQEAKDRRAVERGRRKQAKKAAKKRKRNQ
jgi:hypothetical protein